MSTIARDIPHATAPYPSGAPEIEWPFLVQRDTSAFVIHRPFKQPRAAFNADRMGGLYLPGLSIDSQYGSAYMMAESTPVRTPTGNVEFTRTFATLPGDQVTYGDRTITKPVPPTQDYNSAWFDSIASDATANVWSAALAADAVYRFPSGGTYTLTYVATTGGGPSTTAALDWNATNATIQTALNGLASAIADAITFSVSGSADGGQLIIERATGVTNFSGSQLSADVTGLTPASLTATLATITNRGEVYFARSAITVQKTAHGRTNGETVRVSSSTTGGGTPLVATVLDADNFTVPNASATSPLNPTRYRYFLRTYTPGVAPVVIRNTQMFWLPGVSPGITTAADIPLPTLRLNDAEFLNAVTSSTMGFQDYDIVAELDRWNGWPIYTRTVQAIDFSSV